MGVQLALQPSQCVYHLNGFVPVPLPVLKAGFERGFMKAPDLPPTWKTLLFPILPEAELRQVLAEESSGKYCWHES